MSKGNLFTVSAPSGAGKTSLVKALIERDLDLVLSVSHTTRPPRPGEVHGKDYYFVDQKEFEALISQGAFLEYAEVFGNLYGTAQSSVEQMLSAGRHVLLEIDWQGADQVRRLMPDSVSIFVLPPSRDELERRLRGRGQDSDSVIAGRMSAARDEISHYAEADYIVINDDFERALADMRNFLRGGARQNQHQTGQVQALVEALLS